MLISKIFAVRSAVQKIIFDNATARKMTAYLSYRSAVQKIIFDNISLGQFNFL